MRKSQIFLIIAILGVSICTELNAQNKVLDGVFIKETAPTRRVVPYPHVREADVMYYKRVWREIDIREKMNQSLYYPLQPIQEIGFVRMSLYDILKQGVEEGTITAYDAQDAQFTVPLTKTEVEDILSEENTFTDIDLETGLEREVTTTSYIRASQIAKYWVKEDWFFDRERSVMEVRIIGLLPIINALDENGNVRGPQGLFWVYYPEARYVLANQEVYNRENDGARLTFADLFRKRIFNSYIRQETNVYDNRPVSEYTSGVETLLEARRIEEEIVYFEHDLWQF